MRGCSTLQQLCDPLGDPLGPVPGALLCLSPVPRPRLPAHVQAAPCTPSSAAGLPRTVDGRGSAKRIAQPLPSLSPSLCYESLSLRLRCATDSKQTAKVLGLVEREVGNAGGGSRRFAVRSPCDLPSDPRTGGEASLCCYCSTICVAMG